MSSTAGPDEEAPAPDEAAHDAWRPLEPKESYRALTDVYDMQQDLIDLGDKKARFALVIMHGLNAVAFFLMIRGDAISRLPEYLRPWLVAYACLYGGAAVYFFFQAIESLKPRSEAGRGLPGLRFIEGILGRSPDDYREAWNTVRGGELNEEIAQQIHALSAINDEKYRALRRLYVGLQVLTVLIAGLIGFLEIGPFL